jgi:polar amino acid transport system substrate-binding protein
VLLASAVVGIVAAIWLAAGCRIPDDVNGTLDRVEGGVMRVGVTEHDPWVKLTGAEPGGVEPELARRFASTLDAQIEWTEGSEEELVSALHEGQLDLVVGGFDNKSPWKKKVSFTRPYFDTEVVIGVKPGLDPPLDLGGVRVYGERATDEVGLAKGRTAADVVPVDALEPGVPAAVTDDYLLDELGLREELSMRMHKRVMATQMGENAFLVELERFLLERTDEIGRLIEREGEL